MKILAVCQYYPPEPFRIGDICESLAAAGHEVTVVTGEPNYPMGERYTGYGHGEHRDETVNGVRLHRCYTVPRKSGAVFRLLNYYSFALSSRAYLSRLRGAFDVVFVNQLSPVMMAEGAVAYAKKHRKKLVLYCLDLWPESLTAGGIRKGSLLYRAFARVSKRIYRACDSILITSRSFEAYFRDELGMTKTPITHLPQYAEAQFDSVQPAAIHAPPYRFLFAGNIGEAQAVDTIVETARLLKDDARIRFDVVGDGVELDKCRKLAEGLDHITFYGRRDVSEMPAFYAQADAMLITLDANPVLSLTLPGKVQSYMAAGRAVLGAIDGETPRVVAEADCGACVPARDAAGLADCIRAFEDNPTEFARCGENARAYNQNHFSKRAFLSALTTALEENCV